MTATVTDPATDPATVAIPGLARRSGSTLLRHLLLCALGLIGFYFLSTWLSAFRDLQLAQICYTAIAAAGLTVLTGLSGQISLGHGALMAVGAYSTALILEHQHWKLGVVLILSTVITAVVGVIVGLAAARLRGPYLAGATLALAVGLPSLANYHRLRDSLGGANGLSVTPNPPPLSLGETFPLERWQAWICGLCLIITLFVLANLVRSRIGRDMRLVREDEDAAALCGVNVARTQVLTFSISAACAGLAGGLFAFVNGLAAPGSFPLSLSLALLTACVLGGLGSLTGAIYGSIIVTLLPTWSTDIAQSAHLSRAVYANMPLVVYGVVLIGVIILFPAGLQGFVRWASTRLWVTIRPRLTRKPRVN
jgi:branched-chain amino acid transport system permease protein